MLVGTAPQQPTQNIFLGLPIELRPEEAQALIQKRAAHIVDDAAAHQAALQNTEPNARKAYVESLRRKKRTAQQIFDTQRNKKAAEVAERLGRSPKPESVQQSFMNPEEEDDLDSVTIFQTSSTEHVQRTSDSHFSSLSVTPTASSDLLFPEAEAMFGTSSTLEGPLCRFLLNKGCYMTPGLRFGAKYSVYPGDPLRFHAHYMANQYDWDENIPILDIVGGGRLATAVKKAFLIGGLEPKSDSSHDAQVRTFTIEWAGM